MESFINETMEVFMTSVPAWSLIAVFAGTLVARKIISKKQEFTEFIYDKTGQLISSKITRK